MKIKIKINPTVPKKINVATICFKDLVLFYFKYNF